MDSKKKSYIFWNEFNQKKPKKLLSFVKWKVINFGFWIVVVLVWTFWSHLQKICHKKSWFTKKITKINKQSDINTLKTYPSRFFFFFAQINRFNLISFFVYLWYYYYFDCVAMWFKNNKEIFYLFINRFYGWEKKKMTKN